MVYLTYIIEHYSDLPSTIVFLHHHRDGYPGGWHTDAPQYDNVIAVRSLNIDFVQKNGYANMRCLGVPGCSGGIQPFRDPPKIDIDKSTKTEFDQDKDMLEAWNHFFPDIEVPKQIEAACCAQFAVSKEQVLKRPLSDYEKYRQWIFDTPISDYRSGRVLEYLWHIIFGQPPI
jgi:hypothetical protein